MKNNNLDDHVKAYQGLSIYEFDNAIQLKWYPLRIAGLCKGASSLLELGLGHGITANVFQNYFERHVVVDASPAVIENYRRQYPDSKIDIQESYFEEFVTSELFDVIVFGFVLEHVDDPIKILKHFKKFMAPGGRIFVTVPNSEVLNRRLGHLAGMLPDIEELSDHDRLLGHKRYYSISSLREDIEASGYEITRLEGIYLKPLTTSQMVSLNLSEKIIDALCTVAIDYPELSCGIFAEVTSVES